MASGAFTRGPALSAVESIPLAGGSSSVVFKAVAGHRIVDAGLQLRDGRLLTVLSDAHNEVKLGDPDRWFGSRTGFPRRLTEWKSGASLLGMFSFGGRRSTFGRAACNVVEKRVHESRRHLCGAVR
jgi:hypothetical protein